MRSTATSPSIPLGRTGSIVEPGDAVYLSLTVYGGPDDGRYSERIVGTVNSVEAARRPDGTIHIVLSPDEPDEPDVAWSGWSPTPWPPDHARLPGGPRRAGRRARLGDHGRRPAGALPPGRRGPGAPAAGDDDLGDRAGGHRAHPPGRTERHRSALSGADDHLRMGRRRRRVRHGRLRARRRRGPRHPRPLTGLCVLEHVPLEPAPAHLQLRLRAGDDQRSGGRVRERRVLGHRRLGRARPATPTGCRRPAIAPVASGSVGSCPRRPRRSPRSRCCPWGRYDRTPAPVRIDDLAEPRFTDDVRAILDLMGEAGSQLTPRPRLRSRRPACRQVSTTSARRTTSARLDILCRAMREQGGFNDAGIMQQHTLSVGLLKNRLLIEDLLGRHPEILDEEIAPRSSSAACRAPARRTCTT